MICVSDSLDFSGWRDRARGLLMRHVLPAAVVWEAGMGQGVLAGLFVDSAPAVERLSPTLRVPREFLSRCRAVSYHRDSCKWELMYRILWRLAHGEGRLLEDLVDGDVYRLGEMEKCVRRDLHKMHAFVRFRKVVEGEGEHFIAWHRPDHLIVPAAGPWFASRFPTMRWSILTPDASVNWDLKTLHFGPGMSRADAPAGDELEELWCTYYAAIFNPNRVKIKAMKKEMAVRHWPTLPETQLIPELLNEASKRATDMIKQARANSSQECANTGTAADFVPAKLQLPVLRAAIESCQGCELYCHATQAVFGKGPAKAAIVFVGEQPGDQEDRAGKPFVGPAGQLFDRALEEVGIDRKEVYVTNAVKHFKFEQRGTRRIHSKPNAREAAACRPWLEAELAAIHPKLVVCLGATAAQSLLGPAFRITKDRGRIIKGTDWAPQVMATIHPSAILRTPDRVAKEESYRALLVDLEIAKKAVE